MAESLFDNRYRYDYIYPRGRSGETLRAVDTAMDDRPVVIKRPAPNDAPPIRAGQEVSILNERKVLKMLSGHPVLVEVLGEGQFFVGGMPHQYIALERATGDIIADTVLELASSGDRLPQLEMLVIVDALLDLLESAHARDVIYNDVDAKHLFWSRDAYRLKVIDWGNAVLLDGDDGTSQGITRQSDVFQVGELLYFILSGGRRAEVPRDAGEDFVIDFGEDAPRIPGRLQVIVSTALHPNLRLRYASIDALRKDLTDYRRPLERERDTTVNHVVDRLRHDLSKNELRGLVASLEPALVIDPGFPAGQQARQEIDDRLRDLEVSADLDAVRIYINSGNWNRASELLNELRDKAGPRTTRLVDLLLDTTVLLIDNDVVSMPPTISDAINMMYDGHMVKAAHTLLAQDTPDDDHRRLQWLLAERISSRVPEILLLRPNLYRLDLALNSLEGDGVNLSDARSVLAEINARLDGLSDESINDLPRLRDGFREVVDHLTKLNKLLSTVMVQQRLPNRTLPLSSLDRALNAAMALTDNMHVIGKQATGSPRDALVALDNSRSIDPINPVWEAISHLLQTLYDLLQSYQTYVPSADSSDLTDWLTDTHKDLSSFATRLYDPMLGDMLAGLETASQSWRQFSERVVQGNRSEAVTALEMASSAVNTLSPTLAGWLNQLRSVVEGTTYVERHAVYGGLGRALADGWEMFDRGRMSEAEQLAQRASEIAGSEIERQATERLVNLTSVLREWLERGGFNDRFRTEAAVNIVEALFTEDETRRREEFATQMPSRETYLKAMGRGLVEVYERVSTPAIRLYFTQCIMLGVLEAHAENLDDARFWREVAVRALGEYGQRHEATRVLDEFIERRRSLNEAAVWLNSVRDRETLAKLESIRRQISESPEGRLLAPAEQSIRELQASLRQWADGEFRAAGMKLEGAIQSAQEVERAGNIQVTDYLSWLEKLQHNAAELNEISRRMRLTIDRRPAEADPAVFDAHRELAERTDALIGEPYQAQLQSWYETYQQFVKVYTDQSTRRSGRLTRFNELFKAMFIDRHPAYPLYRHWYDITENSSEFPAPPTSEPTPRIDEARDDDRMLMLDEVEQMMPAPMPVRDVPWRLIVILVVVIGVGGGVAFTLLSGGNGSTESGALLDGPVEVTLETPTDAATRVNAPIVVTDPETNLLDPTDTLAPDETRQGSISGDLRITPTLVVRETNTSLPTLTPSITVPASETVPPTATSAPTATNSPVPTDTLTPTITPTPTLPPQGLQGTQDLLALFDRVEALPWSEEDFSRASGNAGWRFGVAGETPGDEIVVGLDADTIDAFYGNDAPARLRRVEATIAFTTFDPTVVAVEDVYFGVMVESVNDPDLRIGLEVQVVNLTTVNLWVRNGDERTFITQRSVNAIDPRLRVERDIVTGNITLFFDDFQVGDPLPFVSPEAPMNTMLFVRDGGVIVNVTTWRVNLR